MTFMICDKLTIPNLQFRNILSFSPNTLLNLGMSRIVIYNKDLEDIPPIKSFINLEGILEDISTTDSIESLYKVLDQKKNETMLLLFITRDLIPSEEMMLNYLRVQKNTSVIFCGREKWAYRAWKWRVYDFLRLPVRKKEMITTLRKYQNEKLNIKDQYLTLKYQGGFYRIHPQNIVFVKGEGNYSMIWLKDGKRLLVTRKIGEMADMLISYDYIQRVGKSYIFNLSLVRNIDASKITFAANEPIAVKLGASYIKRIQDLLVNG